MGQILCVKKVPFRKSSHICIMYIVIYPPKHQGYLYIYLDHAMCRNFDGDNI